MIVLIIIITAAIVLLGFSVALLSMEKYNEETKHFRIVEKDGYYYIQRHDLIITEDGFTHSVWSYVLSREIDDLLTPKVVKFDNIQSAMREIEQLKKLWMVYHKESFKDYLKGKSDTFEIVTYSE